MIDLVAFDIAGTTVDDGGAVYDALRQCVEELGATVAAADLQHWMGTDKVTAITRLARLGGVEADENAVLAAFERFREILRETYAARPPQPIDGVVATFTELRARGIKVALTTGFDRAVVEPLLASLGWDEALLDAVVTTDDVPAGRPAPYMIFRAMERCGVEDVSRVVAIGDTAVDVQAGRHAGAVAIGVLTGQTGRALLAAAEPDHLLSSVADLPGLLTRAEASRSA